MHNWVFKQISIKKKIKKVFFFLSNYTKLLTEVEFPFVSFTPAGFQIVRLLNLMKTLNQKLNILLWRFVFMNALSSNTTAFNEKVKITLFDTDNTNKFNFNHVIFLFNDISQI